MKYSYYAKIFNEKFNLSFGYPKTDTCGACEQFKNQISPFVEECPEKVAAKKEQEDHLCSAYSELRLDTEISKKNETSNKTCHSHNSLLGTFLYAPTMVIYIWCS